MYFQRTGPDISSFRRWVEAVLISAAAAVTIELMSYLIGMVLVFFTPHNIQVEYDYQSGYPEVCSGRNEGIAFDVKFEGAYEQGIIIEQSEDGEQVMTFNNYYGNSAHVAAFWKRGEGRYEVPPNKKGTCFQVSGFHKDTLTGTDWTASHMDFGSDRTSVKFLPRRDVFHISAHVKVTRCKVAEESQDEVPCEDIE